MGLLAALLVLGVVSLPLACHAALSGTVAGFLALSGAPSPGLNYFDPVNPGLVPPNSADPDTYGNTASFNNVPISDGGTYTKEFGFASLVSSLITETATVDITTGGQFTITWDTQITGPPTFTLTAATFAGLSLAGSVTTSGSCSGVTLSGVGSTTLQLTASTLGPCTATFRLGNPICFPASSTMRRLAPGTTDAWEAVAIPELRLGDTVECLAREPAFAGDGAVASAPHEGRLARCMVYDYKKAAAGVVADYTRITYEGAGAAPGVVSMSSNHHVLDPATGQARQAGSLRAGDLVLRAMPEGLLAPARVLSVDTVEDAGAYAPLLSGGGLPIVDGVAAYPSSGESDVGLDAKHWGQFYLHAPVWQQHHDEAPSGRSLAELGAQQPVGAFTQKWHALGAAAAREGRSSCDWAGVARDMHAAIAQGKKFTEAEALGVFNRHLKAAPGVAAV